MAYDKQPSGTNQYGSFAESGGLRSSSSAKVLPSPSTTPQKPKKRFDFLAAFLIIVWWVTCAEYNVANKLACNLTPAPFTIAAIQLSFGWLWFVPLWLFKFRPAPRFHSPGVFFTKMFPQGVCHCFVHVGAILSMHAGAVSFCHIVKACEPFTTSILSILILGHFFSIQTYMTLLPVVGGVALASFSSPGFNWYAFTMAMLSNLGGSLRGVYGKKTMSDPKAIGTNLTPPNVYSVITICATIIVWPCALAFEGFAIYHKWGAGVDRTLPVEDQPTNFTIARYIISSSFFYYFFNEVAFIVLGRVDQLTHAVSNTMKRVYIIVRSVISHEKALHINTWIGSGIAITGTFLFSMCKQKYG